jgi:tetratricopeptide (TPR) repeat protein
MLAVSPAHEPEVSKEEVLSHLEALLADRRFASAGRNAKFLRYVVERALEGKAGEIKETVIATDVYGRAGDYDPKTDSIVRVEATRLRHKLRSYYENEGRSAAVRIHLPSGAYIPRFEAAGPPRDPETDNTLAPTLLPPPAPVERRGRSRTWAVIASAALLILSIQIARAFRSDARPDPEAVAAFEEGVALLQQDPHVGQAERGAPPILLRAIERLEFAVAKDPGFARAWATLAEAYDYAFPYVGRDPGEDARRAEAAARRAVAIDPKLSAGHHMLGLILFMMKWDFPAAELSYRRALELDPANVYAAIEYSDLLRETGRTEQAAELIRRSRALLPALPQLASKEAEIHLDFGRADAAVAAAHAALQLNRSYTRAYIPLGMAEETKGDTRSALTRYEYALSIDPLDRRALPAYGYLLARMGQTAKARDVVQRLEQINVTRRNCAFQVAMVFAGLGEDERALDWLERAWRTRQSHFPFAVVEPRFRALRNHPRFQELLAKAGLHARGFKPVT